MKIFKRKSSCHSRCPC